MFLLKKGMAQYALQPFLSLHTVGNLVSRFSPFFRSSVQPLSLHQKVARLYLSQQ